ncbi:MAG: ABC transporter substrate-binding protein [Oscillospiraceae bacterium]|nr:ABC transporter substrate-binding protein [Oscillospiraceae bacterium]
MKKLLTLALAMLMVLSLAACGSTGSTGSTNSTNSSNGAGSTNEGDATFTTVEDGKLIMATNCQFPPYEMVADGEGAYQGYEGIDIELAVAIADKLGLELQIDDMDFDSALLAVQNNAADLTLAGLSYNEDRDEVMDFTTKYATGVQVVIVKDGSDVTMDNLGDKLIGTQRGTTGYQYASAAPEDGGYGEDHVIAYDNGATAVQALMNGQVDAVIIDQAPAEQYVAANEGLSILPGNWVEEDYCIAVDQGNTALLNAVQGALDELQADGTVDAIIAKYIKAD